VPIQAENQTLASITFQNYFRLYSKLAGMTGTADTEAYEFQQIYGWKCVDPDPTAQSSRRPRRSGVPDPPEKYEAVIDDIRDCHERGQPMLVGTTSIEESNCSPAAGAGKDSAPGAQRQAARARSRNRGAGRAAGAVTIATNMAGRGTDIVLGGNVEKPIEAVEADEALSPTPKGPDRSCTTMEAGTARAGQGAGRPAHHRHRAARVTAHRQPAARPLGPPG
jgi:preprotein translocase subunit SecA